MVKIIYEGSMPSVDTATQPSVHAVRGVPVDAPENIAALLIKEPHWRYVEDTNEFPRDPEDMTKSELLEILAEMGIDAPTRAAKAELLEMIRQGPVEDEEAN